MNGTVTWSACKAGFRKVHNVSWDELESLQLHLRWTLAYPSCRRTGLWVWEEAASYAQTQLPSAQLSICNAIQSS